MFAINVFTDFRIVVTQWEFEFEFACCLEVYLVYVGDSSLGDHAGVVSIAALQ